MKLFVVILLSVIGICGVFYVLFRTQIGRDMASRVITLNKTVSFENPKKGFSRFETPKFTIDLPEVNNKNIGKSTHDNWKEGDEKVKVEIIKQDTKKKYSAKIYKQQPGKFNIVMSDYKSMKPGNYRIKVTARETFLYERNLEQDFSWGVLAFNTKKSMYTPGETAELGFGVLDERGSTLCNAKLSLEIEAPGGVRSTLSTENKKILISPKCVGNTYSLEEDYGANYKVGKAGRYYMNLTAVTDNGSYAISDYFEVKESVPYSIERTQFPSRIYPVESYPVKFTVKANQDYKGQVYDMVPIDFQISKISGEGVVSRTKDQKFSNSELSVLLKEAAENLKNKNYQIKYKKEDLPTKVDKTPVKVIWNVDWKKGQTYTLTYSIDFPLVSPEYYLLGPFTVGEFKEIRDWQVASDATKCWDGGGGNNNYSTDANWASDTAPVSTSNITFHGGSCTSGTPDKDMTIDATPTLDGTGGGITINSDYTGTITQATNVNVDFSGTIGFVMAGGTYNGGTNNSTVSLYTLFNHTGGSYTATAGTGYIAIGSDFTNSGGTFNHNNGTIELIVEDGATLMVTGSTRFYNFSLNSFACCNGPDIDFASGTTITVENTLDLDPDLATREDLYLYGPGDIIALGNIIVDGIGFRGDVNIRIEGTGNQTLTGGDIDADWVQLPTISINKPSGVLTLVNEVNIMESWNYTKGNIDPGTSTVQFYVGVSSGPNDDINVDVTGSHVLNNAKVYFGNCCNHRYFNFNTGTITVLADLTIDGVGGGNDMRMEGPGKFSAQGNVTFTSGFRSNTFGVHDMGLDLTGGKDQVVDATGCCGRASGNALPTGDWTINKSAGTVNLISDLNISSSNQTLTISSGVLKITGPYSISTDTLDIASGQLNMTAGTVSTLSDLTIGTKGIFTIGPSGTLSLTNNATNNGYFRVQGGGSVCGGANTVAITGSGGSRTWSGSGTYIVNDATIQDMQGTVTAYSSTNNGNTNWTFTNACPAYSNRSVSNVTGGTRVTGGTVFRSN